MDFAVNMYFGEFAEKKKIKIKSELIRHKSQFGVYVLVLPEKHDDIMEIIPAWELNNHVYWKYHADNLKVVGMAVTKEEAFSLAEKILMDVFRKSGNFDVNSFFEFKYL